LHHVPGGPSSSSRTSLSPSSAERCHRVSCRGMRHPVSVTIRPGRSENPATSQKSNGALGAGVEIRTRLATLRVSGVPRTRRRSAARGGFEPTISSGNNRMHFRCATSQCIEESPPRRAHALRRHVLSSCQRSRRSEERAHRGLAPSGFVESRTRSVRLRGGCSPLSYETVWRAHVGQARVELAPFVLKGRCTPLCY
jgi:hypothetical protein